MSTTKVSSPLSEMQIGRRKLLGGAALGAAGAVAYPRSWRRAQALPSGGAAKATSPATPSRNLSSSTT